MTKLQAAVLDTLATGGRFTAEEVHQNVDGSKLDRVRVALFTLTDAGMIDQHDDGFECNRLQRIVRLAKEDAFLPPTPSDIKAAVALLDEADGDFHRAVAILTHTYHATIIEKATCG